MSSKEAESAGSDLMETDYHSFYDEQEPLGAEAPAVLVVPNQTQEHHGENFTAPIDIDWDTAGVRAPGIRDEPNAAMDEDGVCNLLGVGVGSPEEVLDSDVDDDNGEEQEVEEEEEMDEILMDEAGVLVNDEVSNEILIKHDPDYPSIHVVTLFSTMDNFRSSL